MLKRVKDGETDLLYLSPETLLSYSMETLIGDREIGLIIVDEAHIVTTWGVGFRPDYWYLGGYINRLRNQIQTKSNKDKKVAHFPICAFTATAVNGGLDDSVSETIISLYMENPIKYIGYVKRDNIRFNISVREANKLANPVYEERKAIDLIARINEWIASNTKTIAYFPYASYEILRRSAQQCWPKGNEKRLTSSGAAKSLLCWPQRLLVWALISTILLMYITMLLPETSVTMYKKLDELQENPV